MSNSSISVIVFGFYMLGQGLILFFAPNFLMNLFEMPTALDHWVRVVGIALIVLAFYYIQASLLDLRKFFKLTLVGRTIQLVLFFLLVAIYQAPILLIGFATLEFFSGVWTFLALRADERKG